VPPDDIEDGGDGVGVRVLVLPLLSPFQLHLRCRGGCEGSVSGATLRFSSSSRPWWRGVEVVEFRVPFCWWGCWCSFVDVSAPTGHGGEGSCVRRWCGARGGGPRRCGVSWKKGGGRERLLWPCTFSEARIRPSAVDSSCGHLRVVAATSSRRQEVRRRRHRLGAWGKIWI
jgi:hypothetical protein